MYEFIPEYRIIYEALEIPLLILGVENGSVVPILVTDGFLKFYGMTREVFIEVYDGKIHDNLLEKVHPDEMAKLERITDDFVLKKSSEYDVIFRARRDDGYHRIHAVGHWHTMEDGSKCAMIIYSDITKHEDIVCNLADKYQLFQNDDFYTDPLTALPNINYLHKYGHQKAKDLIVMNKKPVIMYYDIDSMQAYNNQYGFEKGDELLILAARILKDVFPEGMVIRGADDHFIVIDSMLTEKELGKRVETVNSRIKSEAFGNTTGIHAGICAYEKGLSLMDGLDHAKQSNKLLGEDLNRSYRFFKKKDISKFMHERYIVENFRRAINEGWIKIYYQCFLRLETGKGAGFEALARWDDPEKGVISPNDFIPVLEKYNLIHEMDLYMFEMVCSEIKPRFDANLPLLPVSVNFSRQDFDYVNIPEELNRIVDKYKIQRYNIDKSYFLIEITERDMAKGTDAFFAQLKQIRKSGFKLWIDDFGSGYSSLNVFSRFDIDLIKFDMDLLKNLNAHNGANREIIRAMIGVAKKLGVHTLCEGMETEEQKAFLIDAGCELAQGFLYHKPEGLDTIFERLGLGIPIPAWETDEEREILDTKWKEKS